MKDTGTEAWWEVWSAAAAEEIDRGATAIEAVAYADAYLASAAGHLAIAGVELRHTFDTLLYRLRQTLGRPLPRDDGGPAGR